MIIKKKLNTFLFILNKFIYFYVYRCLYYKAFEIYKANNLKEVLYKILNIILLFLVNSYNVQNLI